MSNPNVISYRAVKLSSKLPTVGTVSVVAKRVSTSTSENKQAFTRMKSYSVTGELSEKGVKYPVTYDVTIDQSGFDAIALALNLLEEDLSGWDLPSLRSDEQGAYVDPVAGIRLGWIAKKQGESVPVEFYGEFTDGDKKLRASFESFNDLRSVHRLLA